MQMYATQVSCVHLNDQVYSIYTYMHVNHLWVWQHGRFRRRYQCRQALPQRNQVRRWSWSLSCNRTASLCWWEKSCTVSWFYYVLWMLHRAWFVPSSNEKSTIRRWFIYRDGQFPLLCLISIDCWPVWLHIWASSLALIIKHPDWPWWLLRLLSNSPSFQAFVINHRGWGRDYWPLLFAIVRKTSQSSGMRLNHNYNQLEINYHLSLPQH